MFIQTEETPNPNSLKFLPGMPVYTKGIVEFRRGDDAQAIPLAEALFTIEALSGIMFGLDFITITKKEDENWTLLKPRILGTLMEHFSQNLPLTSYDPSAPEPRKPARAKQNYSKDEEAIIHQIEQLIETRIRPAVAKDGGDIIFHDYHDGIVTLTMRGACSGCPSAAITLKSGIERMLQHYIPEITEVRATS